MVQIDVVLSNQIFRILEEWETVLQGLSKDILSDAPTLKKAYCGFAVSNATDAACAAA